MNLKSLNPINLWHRLQTDEDLRRKIYIIVFESDTPAGKMFDILLIGCILLSVLVISQTPQTEKCLTSFLLVVSY